MLFMRTILSLSLATFALSIPVAQPQAVGDLGGVGLIGRDDGSDIFGSIQTILNSNLKEAVTSGSLDQTSFDFLHGAINGIVQSGLLDGGDPGLEADSVNSYLGQIDGVTRVLLSNVSQDVVGSVLTEMEVAIGSALDAGSDGDVEIPAPSAE